MPEVQTGKKCHCVTLLIVSLMVSGLVNVITIALLGTWKCPQESIQAQEMHNVHRNVGLITIDESPRDDDVCTCPNLAWTILEILSLIALVIFSISLAWRFESFSLGQWRQKAQNTKRARMEKLRAELLENEKGAERESHLQAIRMIGQESGKLDLTNTPGYAPRP